MSTSYYFVIIDSNGIQINLQSDRFSNPHGVALDGKGNVYIADYNNSHILKYCC